MHMCQFLQWFVDKQPENLSNCMLTILMPYCGVEALETIFAHSCCYELLSESNYTGQSGGEKLLEATNITQYPSYSLT